MDLKTIGHKLSATGSMLASGAVATAFLSLPSDAPAEWIKPLHAWAIGTIVLGGAMSALGKLLMMWAADDADLASSLAPANRTNGGLLPVVILALLFAGVGGCASATPTYHKGAATMASAYEQAHQNDSDLFDGYEKAAIISHTKRMDAELKQDLQSLSDQARLNPAKWSNPADVSAEQIRLQALHDKKISDYAASLQSYRAIKAKNEEVNLKTARALRDTLNPPKPPAQTVDLTGQIKTSTGAVPVAPIVVP